MAATTPPDPVLDQLLAANATWADDHHDPAVAKVPTRHVAVVTCMDARVQPLAMLGLGPGQAHVLRNAGGVVTEDVERSLLLSQYALGTTAVVVIGHTDCGLVGHDEQATVRQVEQVRGARPPMPLGSLDDPASGVVASVARLRTSAVLAHVDQVHGLVHDVHTGRLERVA